MSVSCKSIWCSCHDPGLHYKRIFIHVEDGLIICLFLWNHSCIYGKGKTLSKDSATMETVGSVSQDCLCLHTHTQYDIYTHKLSFSHTYTCCRYLQIVKKQQNEIEQSIIIMNMIIITFIVSF